MYYRKKIKNIAIDCQNTTFAAG